MDALDDGAALVLVGPGEGAMEGWRGEAWTDLDVEPIPKGKPRGKGIDLPGFVRRRSQQLKQSLQVEGSSEPSQATMAPGPQLAENLLQKSLETAQAHWLNLFGQPPNDAVVEAAMSWLSQDIWPHADLCEGRLFTWSAVGRLMHDLAPAWREGGPAWNG